LRKNVQKVTLTALIVSVTNTLLLPSISVMAYINKEKQKTNEAIFIKKLTKLYLFHLRYIMIILQIKLIEPLKILNL
jgi:hypothetical protein